MISYKNQQTKAKASLIASMVIFGTIGIFRRFIPLPSGMLAMLRGLIGALFLLCIILLRRQRINTKAIKSNILFLIISGALIGFNWILLFEAYRFTSVATATLCYYMAPVFVIFASAFILKEKLTCKSVICSAISLFGMVLVSGVAKAGFSGITELKGILLGLGAAILYASVIIINKKLKNIGAYDKTLVQLFVAGAVLIPYTLLAESSAKISLTFSTVLLVALVGVLHTGITYALYFGSMKDLSAGTIAIFSYIDPIIALILSALILKESMSPTEIFGAILILGATSFNELKKQ